MKRLTGVANGYFTTLMSPLLILLSSLLSALIAPIAATSGTQERVVDIGLGEWAVAMEAKTIRPGAVTFVIRNSGVRTHGFRIQLRSQDGRKLRGRDRMRVRSELIPPGASSKLHVNLSSGIYRVDCFVEDNAGDHSDMGMRTTLVVSDAAPPLERRGASLTPNEIDIERFAFSPKKLTIKAGATIRWLNRDPTGHTVTHTEGDFSSEELEQGAAFSQHFETPGTYPYFCALHPNMKGEIVVKP